MAELDTEGKSVNIEAGFLISTLIQKFDSCDKTDEYTLSDRLYKGILFFGNLKGLDGKVTIAAIKLSTRSPIKIFLVNHTSGTAFKIIRISEHEARMLIEHFESPDDVESVFNFLMSEVESCLQGRYLRDYEIKPLEERTAIYCRYKTGAPSLPQGN